MRVILYNNWQLSLESEILVRTKQIPLTPKYCIYKI